ncbi:Protein of unknown function [Sphingomonas gellani]|uniref:Uncharacterized protein n=1 Tax=Sphingomonas gellani TaxID=1166340 RepID=A0A1H8EJ56_9SPHN|nr:lipopolysaccharide assembly protein LapA domain-containing protein [Sphingomonas gellani]SEN19164.1 Protein of unknown function [Sphingomonas gellani]
MQFLKILFWCLLAFAAALFTYGNWNTVPVHLWAGLIADVNLPLLLLVTFLCGLLPALAFGRWRRWRLGQRLSLTEQELAQVRLTLAMPAPTVARHVPAVPLAPAAPADHSDRTPLTPDLDVPPEPA